MNSSACPERATTLRARTAEYLSASPEMRGDVEEMLLPELKLEVDARVALLIALIAGRTLNDETEQYCADYVKSKVEDNKETLSVFAEHQEIILWNLFKVGMRRMTESDDGQQFFDEIDYYREAYYLRSPESTDRESQYKSTDELIGAGIGTTGEHFPLIIHQIQTVGACHNLSKAERIDLTRNAGHLAMYLSKMELYKLENYVDYINDNPEVQYAMFDLVKNERKNAVSFSPRFMAAFKQSISPKPQSQMHRRHHGCAASVVLPGEDDTALGMCWNWTVGALEKTGYWDVATNE